MLVPTNESKTLKNKKIWRTMESKISKNSDDQDEKYMKIKFDSGDNLRLNKTIEIPIVTIGVGAVFHEYNRYYPQVFFR